MRLLLRLRLRRAVSAILALTFALASALPPGVAMASQAPLPPDPASSSASSSPTATPTFVVPSRVDGIEDLPAGTQELVDKRSANAKHYLLPDGRKVARISASPVHYEQGGTWQDIDTGLVLSAPGVYANAANDFAVTAGQDGDGPPVTVSKDGWAVSMDLLGTSAGAPVVAGDRATYLGSESSLAYDSIATGIKETIYLASADATDTYRLRIETSGCAVVDAGSGLYLLKAYGLARTVGALTPLVVTDSARPSPAECASATMEVVPTQDGALVTYRVPREWLADPARVFPIAIDPGISLSDPEDTFTFSGQPSGLFYSSTALKVGYNAAAAGWCRSYVKQPLTGLYGANIETATLSLYYNGWVSQAGTLYVDRVNTAWQDHVITWGNQGSYVTSTTPVTSIWAAGTYSHWDAVDVTGDIAYFVSPDAGGGVRANGGFRIRSANESATNIGFVFASGDYANSAYHPTLVVTYSEPAVTLESAPTSVTPLVANSADEATVQVRVAYPVLGDIRRIDVAAASGSTGRGAFFWSETTPVAGIWAACGGARPGFVGLDTAVAGSDAVVLDTAACSLVESSGAYVLTLPYAATAAYGDVQHASYGVSVTTAKAAGSAAKTFGPYALGGDLHVVPGPATVAAPSSRGLAWHVETDTDGDGIAENRADSGDSGRGAIDLSWADSSTVAGGYRIYLHDGNTWRSVATTTSRSWTSLGAGLYPTDSAISAIATDSAANPYLSGSGLELRDDPGALYARTAGQSLDPYPGYLLKIVPYNSAGECPQSQAATLSVQLPDRTISAAEVAGSTRLDLGEAAGHELSLRAEAGALAASVTDLELSSFGPRVALSRTYDSLASSSTLLSPGWTFSFEERIETATATYVDETGVRVRLQRAGADSWRIARGMVATLTRDPSAGTWSLVRSGGESSSYDSAGRLSSRSDRNGNQVTYAWGTDGLVITAANGHVIDIAFSAGRVASATYARSGITRRVDYDAAGTSVTYRGTSAGDRCVLYGYTGSKLTSIGVAGATAAGAAAVWQIAYGADGRFARLDIPHAASVPERVVAAAYPASGTVELARPARVGTASADATVTETVVLHADGRQAARGLPALSAASRQGTSTAEWSPYGAAILELSAAGVARSCTYDVRGNELSASDGAGHSTSSTYGDLDFPLTTTDERGSVTSYLYQQDSGDLLRVRRTLSATQSAETSYTYDTNGRMLSESVAIDGSGACAVTLYSGHGDFTDPASTTRVALALGSGVVRDVTDSVERRADGVVLASVDGSGAVVSSRTCDAWGTLLAEADAAGAVTRYRYDALGRAVESSRSAGAQAADWTSRTIDPAGLELTEASLSATGAVLRASTRLFDGSGTELVASVSGEGSSTSAYDAKGEISAVWQPGAAATDTLQATRTLTDADGRTTSVAEPGTTQCQTTTYTIDGLVASEDPVGAEESTFTYDAADSQVGVSQPCEGGARVQASSTYDVGGRMTGSTDASGVVTTYTYDLQDRLVATCIQGAARGSSTVHNAAGWVLSHTDADGNVTTTDYDACGRVIRTVVSPASGPDSVTTHTFDMAGRESVRTNPDGTSITTSYTPFGQPARRTERADGAIVSDVTSSFDELGRVAASTDAAGSGLRHSVRYATPSVPQAAHTYAFADTTVTAGTDQIGREAIREMAVSGSSVMTLAVSARDAAGRASAWVLSAAGVATTQSRSTDAAGRVVASYGPGLASAGVTATYDASSGRKTGERISRASGAVTTSRYTYTPTGRLASFGSAVYDYDAAGFIYPMTAAPRGFEYVDGRLVTVVDGRGGTEEYTYDHLGRRDSAHGPTSRTTFGWDAAGDRLESFRLDTGDDGSIESSAAMSYDAAGQRLSAVLTSASVTTTLAYTYSGLNLLGYSSSTGSATTSVSYLYDEEGSPRGLVARLAETETPIALALATTNRGDVIAMTDAAGATLATWDYDVWGNPTASSVSTSSRVPDIALVRRLAALQVLRYAGYVYDSFSGLYYCSARYYDPYTMQFLSRDPALADGAESAYQYCGGDPVGKVDPSGEVPTVVSVSRRATFTTPWKRVAVTKWVGGHASYEYRLIITWVFDEQRCSQAVVKAESKDGFSIGGASAVQDAAVYVRARVRSQSGATRTIRLGQLETGVEMPVYEPHIHTADASARFATRLYKYDWVTAIYADGVLSIGGGFGDRSAVVRTYRTNWYGKKRPTR